MIYRTFPALARRLADRAHARVGRVRRDGESGFILLESIIAIALITVIMSAVGAEYVSGLASTNNARFQSVAVQVAGSTMDEIQALHPSDLVTGRGATAVDTERTSVANFTTVAGTSYEAYDSSAAAATTGNTFSTLATTSIVGPKTYSTYVYFECTAPALGSSACVTTSSQSSLTSDNIRAIVVVTWPQRGCATRTVTTSGGTTTAPTCSYSTSAVVNADTDPTFDLNQALPAAPAITNPSSLTVAVGDSVNYQMTLTGNTGVAPFTWALTSGSLPSGLTISPAGTITGTVAGSTTTNTSTITVIDAYQRTSSDTITWTVEAPFAITQLADQTGFVGASVNKTVAATGGSGSGYTFSDPNSTLPAGLSISGAGVISGTLRSPVTTYAVTIKATDSQSCPACANTPRTSTMSFNWTVSIPPLSESQPGAQRWTVNTLLSNANSTTVQMTATGGDGRYVWTAAGLPTGITISPLTGLIAGSATSTGNGRASITVSDPTSSAAAANTITFTWTVFATPTITSPGTQTDSRTGTPAVAVSATCPNTACAYTATGLPTGLAINATTGVISGTIATNASSSQTAQVTVTDSAGASATTPSFTWIVLAAPVVGALGTHAYTETQTESAALTYTCPTGSCTLTLSGSIPGLGLTASSSATGDLTNNVTLTVSGTSGSYYIGGTVQGSAVTGSATTAPYTPSVTIAANADGASTTSTATWTAYTAPTVTASGPLVTALGATPTVSFTGTCPNASCSYALLNGPTGLSVNSSGVVTGSVSGASGVYSNVTVSITDANQVGATSSSFTWAVTTTLAAAANNVGVTAKNSTVTNVSSGLFDSVGGTSSSPHESYSADNLLITGTTSTVTAGQQITVNGDTYNWPATAGTGSSDNTVASGQAIAYAGRGATNLGFLFGSSNGNASGTVTITYTDGTSTTATLAAPDWVTAATTYALRSKEYLQAAGSSTITTSSGYVYLYDQQVPINTAKQVAYITLPTTSSGPYLHVFAISQPPLATGFNNYGIGTADNHFFANLDGNGYSLDYESITANGGPTAGATVTAGGLNYEWPNAAGTGVNDNATSGGQVVPFVASGSSTLGFLVTGVNGAPSATGGVVTYSDGSTPTTFSLNSNDWCVHSTGSVAFTSTARYQSGPTNASAIGVYIYYVTVTVNANKTISSITLPSTSNGSTTKLHVFAIGYGS